ncbi:MAG: AbrB/MazE/SpoVT family DNA-binding domain-containing protein [Oceanipulchritudo sp.]
MDPKISKLTIPGRVTIPAEVRRVLNLSAGDSIAFNLKDDHLDLARAWPKEREFAEKIGPMLANEWLSEEDEAAYGDL